PVGLPSLNVLERTQHPAVRWIKIPVVNSNASVVFVNPLALIAVCRVVVFVPIAAAPHATACVNLIRKPIAPVWAMIVAVWLPPVVAMAVAAAPLRIFVVTSSKVVKAQIQAPAYSTLTALAAVINKSILLLASSAIHQEAPARFPEMELVLARLNANALPT